MNTFFTLCSNNYLAQATVLGNSVKKHDATATFIIVLVDRKTSEIDYSAIPFEILPMESIEPRTEELAAKYDIVELNTCVKPRVIEYLFLERNAERVIYLDPDIKVYAPLSELDAVFEQGNVALTPHILTPIPEDRKIPDENAFLNFGIYNLGFIALKNCDETVALARWWKRRTYDGGYIKPEAGMFVDQLYANLMPLFFQGVSVVRHEGYNMAPWNLHERHLTSDGAGHVVNGKRLVFFHFSSFRIDSGELPVHHYNRFSMKDRPDLVELYASYNEDLKAAGYTRFRPVRWAYAPLVEAKRMQGLRRRGRALGRDMLLWAIEVLPSSVTDRVYQVLRDSRT